MIVPPPHLLFLADPNHIVLLLLGGILLIYLEFHVPGAILPGTLGLLMLLLACFGLSLLPLSLPAAALALLGLTLLLIEFKLPTHGLLALVGTLTLIYGLATLVATPAPRVQPALAVSAGLAFGLISFLLAFSALRARRNKILLGPQAMIGKQAIARTPLTPSGTVELRGELWQATLADPAATLPTGHTVQILATENLHLLVKPSH